MLSIIVIYLHVRDFFCNVSSKDYVSSITETHFSAVISRSWISLTRGIWVWGTLMISVISSYSHGGKMQPDSHCKWPTLIFEREYDSDISDKMLSTLSADVASVICFISYQGSMMKILFFFFFPNYKELKAANIWYHGTNDLNREEFRVNCNGILFVF